MSLSSRKARLNGQLFRLVHPFYWRRRTRRLFLVAWPVAVALWPIALMIVLAGCLAFGVFARIERFWNQPRLARVRYNSYGYDVRSRGYEIRLTTLPADRGGISIQ